MAVSKFQELIEYVSLVQHENLDPILRKEAMLAISEMLLNSKSMSPYEAEQVNHFVKTFKVPASVAINRPFKPKETSYQANLSLKYLQNLKPVTIPTLLIREKKDFGSESHTIWVLRFDPDRVKN